MLDLEELSPIGMATVVVVSVSSSQLLTKMAVLESLSISAKSAFEICFELDFNKIL